VLAGFVKKGRAGDNDRNENIQRGHKKEVRDGKGTINTQLYMGGERKAQKQKKRPRRKRVPDVYKQSVRWAKRSAVGSSS